MSEILYKVKEEIKSSPGRTLSETSSSGAYLDGLLHPKYIVKYSIFKSTTAEEPSQLQALLLGVLFGNDSQAFVIDGTLSCSPSHGFLLEPLGFSGARQAAIGVVYVQRTHCCATRSARLRCGVLQGRSGFPEAARGAAGRAASACFVRVGGLRSLGGAVILSPVSKT